MKTPVLETSRIILRLKKISDAGEIFKNWTSDPEVSRYMRWSTHENIQTTVEWLKTVEKNHEGDRSYDWGFILKETGELFGSGGLYYNDEQGMFELGYCIARKHWGKGLTTEAARTLVDFAIIKLGQTRLYCRHAAANPASGRVMEKVGFVFSREGLYERFNGEVFNSREYYFTVKGNN